MAGRDHTGAGKFGPERQRVGGKTHQIVDKQKQPSYARGELTRGKYEVADIGDGLGIGADPLGAFLVEPTWNAPSGSAPMPRDRKSTRLNSSHTVISQAVFCLKKKLHLLPVLDRLAPAR